MFVNLLIILISSFKSNVSYTQIIMISKKERTIIPLANSDSQPVFASLEHKVPCKKNEFDSR